MTPLHRHDHPVFESSVVVLRRIGGAGLVAAGLVLWAAMAAPPAFADGGPHDMNANSGTGGLNADTCASCHRAHTANSANLLDAIQPDSSASDFCLSCHGASGQGATTDVASGVQYAPSADAAKPRIDPDTGAPTSVLGALRGGGFAEARIASSTPARYLYYPASNALAWVGVASSGQPVTSAHLNLSINGLAAPAIAWGNDGLNTGAGPTVVLSCTSCHNPHGNGEYRILNPIPAPDETTSGTFVKIGAPGASVADAALPSPGDARNYTVIQTKGTQGTPSTFLLYASQLTATGYGSTAGDYLHSRVPWFSSTGGSDAPNGNPSGLTPFNSQIETWCTACHTRYHADQGSATEAFGDSVYQYRHQTVGKTACTTCHVAHGSDAQMTGVYSNNMAFPNGATTPTGDSRLLKVDNRGTCQLCHDPTRTVPDGTYTGPTTIPGAP